MRKKLICVFFLLYILCLSDADSTEDSSSTSTPSHNSERTPQKGNGVENGTSLSSEDSGSPSENDALTGSKVYESPEDLSTRSANDGLFSNTTEHTRYLGRTPEEETGAMSETFTWSEGSRASAEEVNSNASKHSGPKDEQFPSVVPTRNSVTTTNSITVNITKNSVAPQAFYEKGIPTRSKRVNLTHTWPDEMADSSFQEDHSNDLKDSTTQSSNLKSVTTTTNTTQLTTTLSKVSPFSRTSGAPPTTTKDSITSKTNESTIGLSELSSEESNSTTDAPIEISVSTSREETISVSNDSNSLEGNFASAAPTKPINKAPKTSTIVTPATRTIANPSTNSRETLTSKATAELTHNFGLSSENDTAAPTGISVSSSQKETSNVQNGSHSQGRNFTNAVPTTPHELSESSSQEQTSTILEVSGYEDGNSTSVGPILNTSRFTTTPTFVSPNSRTRIALSTTTQDTITSKTNESTKDIAELLSDGNYTTPAPIETSVLSSQELTSNISAVSDSHEGNFTRGAPTMLISKATLISKAAAESTDISGLSSGEINHTSSKLHEMSESSSQQHTSTELEGSGSLVGNSTGVATATNTNGLSKAPMVVSPLLKNRTAQLSSTKNTIRTKMTTEISLSLSQGNIANISEVADFKEGNFTTEVLTTPISTFPTNSSTVLLTTRTVADPSTNYTETSTPKMSSGESNQTSSTPYETSGSSSEDHVFTGLEGSGFQEGNITSVLPTRTTRLTTVVSPISRGSVDLSTTTKSTQTSKINESTIAIAELSTEEGTYTTVAPIEISQLSSEEVTGNISEVSDSTEGNFTRAVPTTTISRSPTNSSTVLLTTGTVADPSIKYTETSTPEESNQTSSTPYETSGSSSEEHTSSTEFKGSGVMTTSNSNGITKAPAVVSPISKNRVTLSTLTKNTVRSQTSKTTIDTSVLSFQVKTSNLSDGSDSHEGNSTGAAPITPLSKLPTTATTVAQTTSTFVDKSTNTEGTQTLKPTADISGHSSEASNHTSYTPNETSGLSSQEHTSTRLRGSGSQEGNLRSVAPTRTTRLTTVVSPIPGRSVDLSTTIEDTQASKTTKSNITPAELLSEEGNSTTELPIELSVSSLQEIPSNLSEVSEFQESHFTSEAPTRRTTAAAKNNAAVTDHSGLLSEEINHTITKANYLSGSSQEYTSTGLEGSSQEHNSTGSEGSVSPEDNSISVSLTKSRTRLTTTATVVSPMTSVAPTTTTKKTITSKNNEVRTDISESSPKEGNNTTVTPIEISVSSSQDETSNLSNTSDSEDGNFTIATPSTSMSRAFTTSTNVTALNRTIADPSSNSTGTPIYQTTVVSSNISGLSSEESNYTHSTPHGMSVSSPQEHTSFGLEGSGSENLNSTSLSLPTMRSRFTTMPIGLLSVSRFIVAPSSTITDTITSKTTEATSDNSELLSEEGSTTTTTTVNATVLQRSDLQDGNFTRAAQTTPGSRAFSTTVTPTIRPFKSTKSKETQIPITTAALTNISELSSEEITQTSSTLHEISGPASQEHTSSGLEGSGYQQRNSTSMAATISTNRSTDMSMVVSSTSRTSKAPSTITTDNTTSKTNETTIDISELSEDGNYFTVLSTKISANTNESETSESQEGNFKRVTPTTPIRRTPTTSTTITLTTRTATNPSAPTNTIITTNTPEAILESKNINSTTHDMSRSFFQEYTSGSGSPEGNLTIMAATNTTRLTTTRSVVSPIYRTSLAPSTTTKETITSRTNVATKDISEVSSEEGTAVAIEISASSSLEETSSESDSLDSEDGTNTSEAADSFRSMSGETNFILSAPTEISESSSQEKSSNGSDSSDSKDVSFSSAAPTTSTSNSLRSTTSVTPTTITSVVLTTNIKHSKTSKTTETITDSSESSSEEINYTSSTPHEMSKSISQEHTSTRSVGSEYQEDNLTSVTCATSTTRLTTTPTVVSPIFGTSLAPSTTTKKTIISKITETTTDISELSSEEGTAAAIEISASSSEEETSAESDGSEISHSQDVIFSSAAPITSTSRLLRTSTRTNVVLTASTKDTKTSKTTEAIIDSSESSSEEGTSALPTALSRSSSREETSTELADSGSKESLFTSELSTPFSTSTTVTPTSEINVVLFSITEVKQTSKTTEASTDNFGSSSDEGSHITAAAIEIMGSSSKDTSLGSENVESQEGQFTTFFSSNTRRSSTPTTAVKPPTRTSTAPSKINKETPASTTPETPTDSSGSSSEEASAPYTLTETLQGPQQVGIEAWNGISSGGSGSSPEEDGSGSEGF